MVVISALRRGERWSSPREFISVEVRRRRRRLGGDPIGGGGGGGGDDSDCPSATPDSCNKLTPRVDAASSGDADVVGDAAGGVVGGRGKSWRETLSTTASTWFRPRFRLGRRRRSSFSSSSSFCPGRVAHALGLVFLALLLFLFLARTGPWLPLRSSPPEDLPLNRRGIAGTGGTTIGGLSTPHAGCGGSALITLLTFF